MKHPALAGRGHSFRPHPKASSNPSELVRPYGNPFSILPEEIPSGRCRKRSRIGIAERCLPEISRRPRDKIGIDTLRISDKKLRLCPFPNGEGMRVSVSTGLPVPGEPAYLYRHCFELTGCIRI